MAKLSTDQLIDAFKELTLIELSEFVSQFEEVFNVTRLPVVGQPVEIHVLTPGRAVAGGGERRAPSIAQDVFQTEGVRAAIDQVADDDQLVRRGHRCGRAVHVDRVVRQVISGQFRPRDREARLADRAGARRSRRGHSLPGGEALRVEVAARCGTSEARPYHK